MDSRTATVGCMVAGVVLVAVAGVALDPPGDRPMVVTHVDGMGELGGADATYADLSPSAQAAVDDALDDGYASLSTAAPVVAGVALGRRDWRLGALALGTLGVAVGELLLGEGTSGLGLLVSLGVLSLPGLLFGWRLDQAVTPGRASGGESSHWGT